MAPTIADSVAHPTREAIVPSSLDEEVAFAVARAVEAAARTHGH